MDLFLFTIKKGLPVLSLLIGNLFSWIDLTDVVYCIYFWQNTNSFIVTRIMTCTVVYDYLPLLLTIHYSKVSFLHANKGSNVKILN